MQDKEEKVVFARDTLHAPVAPAAAVLVRRGGDTLQCLACAHQCRMKSGKTGICRVRFNRDGVMMAPHGYVAGLQVDPIEKKPFYHVLPGRNALSFGMLGCNLQCSFCQNWISSQMPYAQKQAAGIHACSPSDLVDTAVERNAPVLVSTYNEPLITADWAAQIFEKACEKNLLCGFVSNGFASKEVITFLRPVTALFKVDLKCFTDAGYRSLGGRLQPVLDTIETLAASGIWVEVVTLVVPGFNDSEKELAGIAMFLAGVSVDIPWHVTAFYPTYKMADGQATTRQQLDCAWEAGKAAGLRYVYAGNMAGRVADKERTFCHQCNALLVERTGYHILQCRITDGKCPDCQTVIPGRWHLDG